MKVVWRTGRASVRDVYEALREHRPVAYTTVMTMMKVLQRKGHVKVEREGRAHVYTAAKPQQRVLREMVREFLNRVFDGASEPLVQHLVRDGRLTEGELREIVRRVKEDG